MNGYIMLPRALYSHPVMHNGSSLQCFLRILYNARFQPETVYFNGRSVALGIGQCVLSRHELAAELRITPSQVRCSIEKLVAYGLISVASNNHHSVVTVTNFGLYQPVSERPQRASETTNATPAEQTAETHVLSEENDNLRQRDSQHNSNGKANKKKKVNNNINNIYIRAFEEFWSKYPNRFNRPQTEKNFVKAAKAHGADAVLRALDRYIAEIEAVGTDKQYIARSTNFVGQKAYFLGYLDDDENKGSNTEVRVSATPDADETKRMLAQMRGDM